MAIHQSTFLRNLSLSNEVVLVVQKAIGDGREKEGWEIPDFGKTEIITSPSKKNIENIVRDNKDAIHIFSGINAYQTVYSAFKYAIKYKTKKIVYAEPYNWLGWKGFLRRIKYIALFLRYEKFIDALLATGENGVKCYKKAFFPKSKLYQWGYFTEKLSNGMEKQKREEKLPSLLFVGRLDKNKNILSMLSLIVERKLLPFRKLTIIGGGYYEERIKAISNIFPEIQYIGLKPNKEVNDIMKKNDILILPSKYDGWGAVVNEALMNGMRVVVSENCGSSSLIKDKQLGSVFSFHKKDDMGQKINEQISLGIQTEPMRESIINWTYKTISGDVVSKYFVKICDSVYQGKQKPCVPWIEEKYNSKI